MRIVRSLNEIQKDPATIVSVGTFDGVHLAHQEIVREVVNRARMKEGRSVIVTFEPHPKEVVGSPNGPVRLLTTLDDRIALLEHLNVGILFIINFTYEFSRLTPRAFYENYVVKGIGASEVVVGYDHMFGRDRKAGIAELITMGKEFNFSVFAVHPYTVDGEIVSSTTVRKELSAGNIERANMFLGYQYSLQGSVVPGDRRGKSIGYPTANISPLSVKKLVPGRGVYLVAIDVGGRQLFGMMNIGVRPTVTAAGEETIEVHIFDLHGDIYGEHVTVSFLKRLRDEKQFASVRELVMQLARDKEESLKYVSELVRPQ